MIHTSIVYNPQFTYTRTSHHDQKTKWKHTHSQFESIRDNFICSIRFLRKDSVPLFCLFHRTSSLSSWFLSHSPFFSQSLSLSLFVFILLYFYLVVDDFFLFLWHFLLVLCVFRVTHWDRIVYSFELLFLIWGHVHIHIFGGALFLLLSFSPLFICCPLFFCFVRSHVGKYVQFSLF